MKIFMWFLVVLGVMLLICVEIMAQPPVPSAPSQAPLDGGLGILAAAGGSYALHKLRKKRNKKEEESL